MKATSVYRLSWVVLILILSSCSLPKNYYANLSQIGDTLKWTLHNREASEVDREVHLDAREFDGLLWLNDYDFENGIIQLDIKGRDDPGKSFVGLAFHGLNDSTFDAVYFRPFNFKNPDRKGHSVQYISHPVNTWSKLREEHPGEYENTVIPVPDPNDWFHVKIIIENPLVKVYVNDSEEASLTVEQLSDRKTGWIGFWVGNGSEGYFRNLLITTGV